MEPNTNKRQFDRNKLCSEEKKKNLLSTIVSILNKNKILNPKNKNKMPLIKRKEKASAFEN